MTKEQWVIMRDLEEIPMVVWFEYYLENGGFLKDFSEFSGIFSQLLLRPIILSSGKVVALNFATCVYRLHHYYDTKFDL